MRFISIDQIVTELHVVTKKQTLCLFEKCQKPGPPLHYAFACSGLAIREHPFSMYAQFPDFFAPPHPLYACVCQCPYPPCVHTQKIVSQNQKM
jgi:hypothetical protein